MTRIVVVYIACSIDGYIANIDGDISFLSVVEKKGEDYGYAKFIKEVDTVIMGRKTYDKVMSYGIPFPHKDLKTYVLTHDNKESEGNVIFYNKNLNFLVLRLKQCDGGKVFVDGGAEVIHTMLLDDLIDEMVISVIPVMLGDGIRLFRDGGLISEWELKSVKSFESGLVQSHYVKLRNN